MLISSQIHFIFQNPHLKTTMFLELLLRGPDNSLTCFSTQFAVGHQQWQMTWLLIWCLSGKDNYLLSSGMPIKHISMLELIARRCLEIYTLCIRARKGALMVSVVSGESSHTSTRTRSKTVHDMQPHPFCKDAHRYVYCHLPCIPAHYLII